MDSIAINFLVGCVLVIVVLIFSIYSFINYKWKQKPILPFVIGLVVLLGSFVWYLGLSMQSADMKYLIQKNTDNHTQIGASASGQKAIPTTTMAFWKSNVVAYDAQAKLIEFLLIPLAVSLIAAAFFVKADLALSERKNKYVSLNEGVNQREKQIAERESELESQLENGDRGPAIVAEYKIIRRLRIDLVLDRIELEKEYADILS